ncbi:hypothetical protein [Gordonia rhizosphera]|uniref:Uncharacterized protein n=1 Tax=Gordonia rhizosphera NBRC 16068 TaxID=1108045 RepID=K6V7F1_9ACTN|nr:hypothetical protein [Gordonia rhizosphera]GAB92163.1 hypothetical protein GORHZ_164_00560 [Gordonia rhizosphera NBRC 16068]
MTGGHHGSRPQYWLESGPMLPRRRWQRTTRSPVIVISVLAALALTAVAGAALVVGLINSANFTAQGTVVCPTNAAQASRIVPGAAVVIYDLAGDQLASTTLGPRSTVAGRCEMAFTAESVDAGRGEYLVRVGDSFQETVSESALVSGAVLRPLG